MKVYVFLLLLNTLIHHSLSAAAETKSNATFISQLVTTLKKGPEDKKAVDRALEIINDISQSNKTLLNQEYNGSTPLAWAALYGVHQVVTALCKLGINPNVRMRSASTALHAAASTDYSECVRILLSYKADPTLKNNAQQTALHKALISFNTDAALQLINAGAPLDAQDNFGNTPFSLAQTREMHDIIESIKAKKA